MALPIWLLPYLDARDAQQWQAEGWLSCSFLGDGPAVQSRLLVSRVLAMGGQGITLLVVNPLPSRGGQTSQPLQTQSPSDLSDVGGRLNVLKIPRPESLPDELRFRQEIEIHSQIHHPRIVEYRGEVLLQSQITGQLPPQPGFLMEYISGGTLHGLLRGEYDNVTDGRRRVPVREAFRIFGDILDGIEAIHQHGWIHRDLKPKNVLIDVARGRMAKLCDFGAVRDPNSTRSITTSSGLGPGSLGYIAPERLSNQPVTDSRGDYFSAGCILAEMLTGVCTFPKAPLATVQLDPQGLDEIQQHYGTHVVELVSGLLHKDPDQRWSSPQQIREAIQSILKAKVPRRSIYWSQNWPPLTPVEPHRSQVRQFLHEDAPLYHYGSLQEVGTMMALHSERFVLVDFLDALSAIHCLLWRTIMDLTKVPEVSANETWDELESLRLKVEEFENNCQELLDESLGSFSKRLKQRLQFVNADAALFRKFEYLRNQGELIKRREQEARENVSPASANVAELRQKIADYTKNCQTVWRLWLKLQSQIVQRISECSDELVVALAAIL